MVQFACSFRLEIGDVCVAYGEKFGFGIQHLLVEGHEVTTFFVFVTINGSEKFEWMELLRVLRMGQKCVVK